MVHEFLLPSTFWRLVSSLLQRQGLLRSAGPGRGLRVLDELGSLRDPLAASVLEAVPEVAPRCGLAPFEPVGVDMRVLSRANDYLEPTHDATVDDRALGFVLFLHREPRTFEGGSLHLHTSTNESVIEPSQNSMIFFRSSIAARVGAVFPASSALVDSHHTLEGCIRR